jgi:hypothetical protein
MSGYLEPNSTSPKIGWNISARRNIVIYVLIFSHKYAENTSEGSFVTEMLNIWPTIFYTW